MMPLLGPFTTRNVFGLGMDEIVLDPLNYVLPFYTLVIRFGVEIISVRYEKLEIYCSKLTHCQLMNML